MTRDIFGGNKAQKLFLVQFRYRHCFASVIMRPSGYFIIPRVAIGAIWVWNPSILFETKYLWSFYKKQFFCPQSWNQANQQFENELLYFKKFLKHLAAKSRTTNLNDKQTWVGSFFSDLGSKSQFPKFSEANLNHPWGLDRKHGNVFVCFFLFTKVVFPTESMDFSVTPAAKDLMSDNLMKHWSVDYCQQTLNILYFKCCNIFPLPVFLPKTFLVIV